MSASFKQHLLILPLAGLAACAAGAGAKDDNVSMALEVQDQELRTGWYGDGHAEATADGLFFLKNSRIESLSEANEAIDGSLTCDDLSFLDWFTPSCGSTKLNSTFHVDNCRVGETFSSINDRYRALVETLEPADPDFTTAIKLFGSILHTTQDFFAHTNWVDAGRTALLNHGGFLHAPVAPGGLVGNMRLAATPLPPGFSVRRASGSRVPEVWDGTAWSAGLISGTYDDNEDSSICPSVASIPHGAPFFQGENGSYLAKDDPDSHNHQAAVDMATGQTTEEFCRLVRLVTLRHGFPGGERLLSEWVGSIRAGYHGACPYDRSIVTAVFMAVI